MWRQVFSPSAVVLCLALAAAALLWALCRRPAARLFIIQLADRVFWARRARYYLSIAVFLFAAYLSRGPFYWNHFAPDESGYLLQARMYTAGMWSLPIKATQYKIDLAKMVKGYKRTEWPARNRNFFLSPLEGVVGGKWIVLYSPTYPLLLAAGVKAGVPWLPNALFAGASVLLAAYAAERIYGARAGAAAAWFFAASPALTLKAGSYYSETAFIFFYLIFVILFFTGVGGRTGLLSLVLGIVWGITFTVREYSTFVGTLPFLAIGLVSAFRERRWGTLWFVPGTLIGLTPVLVYNSYITANPFFFPRFISPLQHFARDGITALEVTVLRLWCFNSDALGWPFFSLAPIILTLILIREKRIADKVFLWSVAATIILFIPVNAVGIDYGSRYFITGVVGTVFLAARLVAFLRQRFSAAGTPERRRRRLSFLNGVLIISVIVAFFTMAESLRQEVGGIGYRTRIRSLWETPALRRALAELNVHNAVVFIGPYWHGVGPMTNSPALDDDIIFARDQGERNAELMAAFPGRRFLRCDYGTFAQTGTLFEITARGE